MAARTKDELRARMETGLRDLLSTLDGLSEAEMLGSVDAEGWNIRDHVVHLAVWADGIAALLHRENRWKAMGLDIPEPDGEPDYDVLNAAIMQQHSGMSGLEARDWLMRAHRAVETAMDSLGDNELVLHYGRFQAPFDGDFGEPIAEYILGNTEDHYDEHTPWIKTLIRT